MFLCTMPSQRSHLVPCHVRVQPQSCAVGWWIGTPPSLYLPIMLLPRHTVNILLTLAQSTALLICLSHVYQCEQSQHHTTTAHASHFHLPCITLLPPMHAGPPNPGPCTSIRQSSFGQPRSSSSAWDCNSSNMSA